MTAPTAPKTVLFICTGNICRSPMAEGLFRKLLGNEPGLQVMSAGVNACYGQAASPHTVELLRRQGIDLTRFRSQPLTRDLVAKSTWIFAMTRSHLDSVLLLFPEAADKTFLVCEFDPELSRHTLDIPDPIGMGLDAYQRTYDLLHQALPSVLKFIRQPPDSMNPSATKPLRIALGADHGGVALKRAIQAHLGRQGFVVSDLGAFSDESVDYPDFADAVCREVIADHFDYGILFCKSGIGMSIAANRHPHIRAALVDSEESARVTRQHNDSNVLCLAADRLEEEEARNIVDAYLSTSFEGGRHARRVEKLDHLHAAAPATTGESLAQVDPQIAEAIRHEARRQFENIELIASENFTSRAVMEAQGSCLTNKYAEGYPGKRWYGGCENVGYRRAARASTARRQLFGAEHVNVQAHSGSQANMAVYFSVLQPGDRILTMDLSHGGHLTHGNKANFSGRFFEVSHYGVSPERAHRLRRARPPGRGIPAQDDHGRRLRLPAHH